MTWALVPNPTKEGPVKATEFCHDGTPFLTIGCKCGEMMHLHESQIPADIFDHAIIETRCVSCFARMEIPVSTLRKGIRESWA